MDSPVNTKQADPRDVSPGLSTQDVELVARADERLAHAYAQIASADEQLARVNEQMSRMEDDAARKKAVNSFVGRRAAGRRCAASSPWCWRRVSVSPLSLRSLTAKQPG